jgi:hypothetical protein
MGAVHRHLKGSQLNPCMIEFPRGCQFEFSSGNQVRSHLYPDGRPRLDGRRLVGALRSPHSGTSLAVFLVLVFSPVRQCLAGRCLSGKVPATQKVILRQSMWVGFFGSTLAWLQIGRVVTPAVATLLAVGLASIEWLLRLRERGQWRG